MKTRAIEMDTLLLSLVDKGIENLKDEFGVPLFVNRLQFINEAVRKFLLDVKK